MKARFPRALPVVVILLALLLNVGVTAAQQPPPMPTVQTNCPHVLRAGIPFAWLRFEPSSLAGFAVTLRPGETVQLNNPPVLAWDNVQWWVYVWPNAAPGHGYYWVELNSLEPQCQPTPPPTPGPGAAPWSPGTVVRVKFSVPFVWFRGGPHPGSAPTYTVYPGTQLVIVQGAAQDNFGQWWWVMRDPRNGFTGWVEQNLVELLSSVPAPVPPTGWQVGDIVRVRGNIPFSWLRHVPSSTSGFSYTAQSGQELIVQLGQHFDGVQNWRQVLVPNSTISGWVEVGSLEFVRRP